MTPLPAPTASASPARGPVPPLVLVAAVLGAVALGVVLAGPLHALLARFVHRPDFAKVYRYLTLGLLVATLVVLLRPWRDVPRDLWGLRGPPGRTAGLLASGVVTMAVLLAVLAGRGHREVDWAADALPLGGVRAMMWRPERWGSLRQPG